MPEDYPVLKNQLYQDESNNQPEQCLKPIDKYKMPVVEVQLSNSHLPKNWWGCLDKFESM